VVEESTWAARFLGGRKVCGAMQGAGKGWLFGSCRATLMDRKRWCGVRKWC